MRAAMLASLNQIPAETQGGGFGLVLCGVALALIPREKRRRLVWCVVVT